MKKPTIHKKLSLKKILKRHRANPQDKELHEIIESEGDNSLREEFNKLIQKSTKQKPFDKMRKRH